MSENDRVKTLFLERAQDVERMIEAGLPGCYAIGYVPGRRSGSLRRADPNHIRLAEALLARLPPKTVH